MSAGRPSRAPLAPDRDDALNEQIQAVLREAAEALAARSRAQAAADAEAAARHLDEILTLARGGGRTAAGPTHLKSPR